MKRLLSFASMLFLTSIAMATGNYYIVQEGACNCLMSSGPNVYGYNSINGAVTAAANGDTIMIRNRAGNLPWTEAVTFPASKSLTVVPYAAWTSGSDNVFYCQGVWTITGTAGYKQTIVGMYNYTGSVVTTAAATSGSNTSRDTVRLLGGQIGTSTTANNTSGFINFAYNYYDLNVIGMKIFCNSGTALALEHGSIIGDSIVTSAGNCIAYSSDAVTTSDTGFIIGNVISDLSTSSNSAAINWSSTYLTFDFRNNLIYSADVYGIDVSSTKAAVSPINKIYNNTIIMTGISNTYSPGMYAMYLNPNTTPATIEVQNNLLSRTVATTTYATYGIYSASTSGIVNCYYNYIDADLDLDGGAYTYQVAANIGTNSSNALMGTKLGTGGVTTPYPPTSGSTQATTALGYYISTFPAGPLNGGNAGYAYANLGSSYSSNGAFNGYTQNTVGCYGGPFDIQNYFAPSSTYPYQTAKPNQAYLLPGWVPTLLINGAAITSGNFKISAFQR